MVVDAGIRQDDREEVTVHPSVTAALPEIAALCERLGVSRLDLFGSATGPEFVNRPVTSMWWWSSVLLRC